MRAVICVGFRPGAATRELIWSNARPFYEAMPWPVYVGDSDPSLPYNWSQARNAAAAQAEPWDVAAFLDADVHVPEEQLREAFSLAHATGEAIIPFTDTIEVDRDGSAGYYAAEKLPPGPDGAPGIVSGNIVIPRSAFDAVHGWDERITTYGFEDWCMLLALSVLAGVRRSAGVLTRYNHERLPSEYTDHEVDMPLVLPGYLYASRSRDRRDMRRAVER